MRRMYRAILKLYPCEHQASFAAEMVETFEQSFTDCRQRGRAAMFRFALRELTGLLEGLTTEWLAKSISPRVYITPRCYSGKDLRQKLILHMEHAIAHHDFTKARFYSAALDRLERKIG